ncbi:hypothetical protein F2Q69_00055890 [Brassica cretica]|uniref:Uncharacterized protein n=1 Tax=Brassica cretica TaxID=69181 RepID=A0A8S9MYW3_BRACR|nr:hypothetical protein F2Q69_00055890 [Brassica cretica]
MITKFLTPSFRSFRFFKSPLYLSESLAFGVKYSSMAEVENNVNAAPVSDDELYSDDGVKLESRSEKLVSDHSVDPFWFSSFVHLLSLRAIKDTDVDAFVEDVLVNGKPWTSGVQEELSGSFVFVCAHGSRDKRCGVCGPALMEKFEQEIGSRGLSGKIFVKPCSHIGGHKYAGNLIVFSPDSAGNVSGHWYGYVTPDDVPAMLDQHIAKGEIIQNLSRFVFLFPACCRYVSVKSALHFLVENCKSVLCLASMILQGIARITVNKFLLIDSKCFQYLYNFCFRGKMGLIPEGEEAVKEDEHKIPNGNGLQVEKKGFTGGCCQGANGVSCCQEQTPEPVKKEGSVKKNWFRSIEKEELLLGAAAVGAVATIAVAYSIYRKSG